MKVVSASFDSKFRSIMETALEQVSQLVGEETTELRLEVNRLTSVNSTLTEKVQSLQQELSGKGRKSKRGSRPKSCHTIISKTEDTAVSPTVKGGKDSVEETPSVEGKLKSKKRCSADKDQLVECQTSNNNLKPDPETEESAEDPQEADGEHSVPIENVDDDDKDEDDDDDDNDFDVAYGDDCKQEEWMNSDPYMQPVFSDGRGGQPTDSCLTCTVCTRTFFHRATLTRHMKFHKSNYCDICKRSFVKKNRQERNTHVCVPQVLPELEDKTCEFCGKVFLNYSSLKTHLAVHTGLRPFSCTFCKRGFSQKGNLKNHLLIHTGETPFVCIKCGKRFRLKGELKKHFRRRHQKGGSETEYSFFEDL